MELLPVMGCGEMLNAGHQKYLGRAGATAALSALATGAGMGAIAAPATRVSGFGAGFALARTGIGA